MGVVCASGEEWGGQGRSCELMKGEVRGVGSEGRGQSEP